MPREVLDESKIHPSIRETVASHHRDIVDEVKAAIATHDVVVVGMAQNPNVGRARSVLKGKGIAHQYLEYGSYFSQWRRRTALKKWSGWPTFPMVFVKGMLVGGADELTKLAESGGLATMLKG
ncbi:MAG: glutaredoxin [Myxococcota bacterium]|nr:glutaredoxin [Myxococcota bacterium]